MCVRCNPSFSVCGFESRSGRVLYCICFYFTDHMICVKNLDVKSGRDLAGLKLGVSWQPAGRGHQILAPNDVKITRWQHLYPGYFGFTSLFLYSGRKRRRVVHLNTLNALSKNL